MEALTQRLERWLAIDSVTPGERAFMEELERELSARGYTCARQEVAPDRWNLLATRSAPARVLFSTHVDTVPPHLPVRREGDTIYGRGACDTKGGLLAMVEAAQQLVDAGCEEVGFLLVVGEEVDHIGAKTSRALGIAPERIILDEPTVCRVVAAQKGMVKLNLLARGIAAHSAYPSRGVSAIHKLIGACGALLAHQWPSDPILGPTTLNVGTIGGGVAFNVFAPQAEAEVLFRSVCPTDQLMPEIARLCAAHDVEVTIAVENGPVFFDPPEGVETCTVAFNTDATYLSQIAPVWLVGPGDIEVAHTDHEHIELSQIEQGITLYARLARLALGLDA